ncbi:sugar (pentulose or hexulose) kinase [Maribacter caenipelagi]|uniref:Sugar (Pentulose or hexulose) kinase n=1 Tax=Maribacter caenipelagi TaxID=1447781 RepID=A0A4R7D098_9FLAO|nr:FGGY family carbohydrate kinase [Maribacter caenipelagi]TDS14339.1 sugar (pentulose or hexulose) kinase [Maribacter caenipelagi]
MKKVTAIFDIGKTNKKFFLFDTDYQEVYREYSTFETIADEDGHPTEDLKSLQDWLKSVFDRILKSEKYNITAVNFSTYGASLVHVDENGEVVAPLYNYTKHISPELKASFFQKYGPEEKFCVETGSSLDGMLNSGMQLYWLKHSKPETFKKIKYSLHLPQYISYIFTEIPISEYTSIGCHTAMWDFKKKDYHDWIYAEGLHKILPPLVSTETGITMNYNGKRIKVGVGIHDSSASLLPYSRSIKKKFLLVSTGTWSIALNPFSEKLLTEEDVANDCINYMRINGKPVKSARLFLGEEYSEQVKQLTEHFKVDPELHKSVKFCYDTYFEIIKDFVPMFRWMGIKTKNMPEASKITYDSFEHAYHHLMIELVMLQVESIKIAVGNDVIEKLYIDGGFSDNDVYIKLVSHYLRNMELRTTDSSLGSALGAAIAISDTKLNSKFLKKNYCLKKHVPFILK